MIIDHFGFGVSDYQRAKAFYAQALAPLGIALVMEFGPEQTGAIKIIAVALQIAVPWDSSSTSATCRRSGNDDEGIDVEEFSDGDVVVAMDHIAADDNGCEGMDLKERDNGTQVDDPHASHRHRQQQSRGGRRELDLPAHARRRGQSSSAP